MRVIETNEQIRYTWILLRSLRTRPSPSPTLTGGIRNKGHFRSALSRLWRRAGLEKAQKPYPFARWNFYWAFTEWRSCLGLSTKTFVHIRSDLRIATGRKCVGLVKVSAGFHAAIEGANADWTQTESRDFDRTQTGTRDFDRRHTETSDFDRRHTETPDFDGRHTGTRDFDRRHTEPPDFDGRHTETRDFDWTQTESRDFDRALTRRAVAGVTSVRRGRRSA
jgi:hypothetical protein